MDEVRLLDSREENQNTYNQFFLSQKLRQRKTLNVKYIYILKNNNENSSIKKINKHKNYVF